jgi:hypothetical protein
VESGLDYVIREQARPVRRGEEGQEEEEVLHAQVAALS